MGEPTKTVHNERTKLTATLLNGVAIASVVAGVITPLAALSFGFGSTSSRNTIAALLISFAWLNVGLSLHIVARIVLGRLRE